MYYVELIDRFWSFNEEARLGHTAIAVYLYLLKTSKDKESYQFSVSDVELGKRLGLTRATVKSAKGNLQHLGLIEYRTMNGVAGTYRLVLNYPLEILNSKKAESEPQKNDILIIEDKSTGSTETQSKSVNVPSINEFLEYAQTLEAYTPELDALIIAKYSSWTDNGWKSFSGRAITNWRSSLKNVLPFLSAEDRDTQQLHNIPDIRHPK